jgi:hypothetical protein
MAASAMPTPSAAVECRVNLTKTGASPRTAAFLTGVPATLPNPPVQKLDCQGKLRQQAGVAGSGVSRSGQFDVKIEWLSLASRKPCPTRPKP